MSDGGASTLPLSRSDRSLVCSSCRQQNTVRDPERERGREGREMALDLLISQL